MSYRLPGAIKEEGIDCRGSQRSERGGNTVSSSAVGYVVRGRFHSTNAQLRCEGKE